MPVAHRVRQHGTPERLENGLGRRARLAERPLEQRPTLARVHRTKDGARAEPGEVRGDELDDLVAESTEIVGGERRRRSEEHTSELQSLAYLVCRLLLE